jgi:hypothetical protein
MATDEYKKTSEEMLAYPALRVVKINNTSHFHNSSGWVGKDEEILTELNARDEVHRLAIDESKSEVYSIHSLIENERKSAQTVESKEM